MKTKFTFKGFETTVRRGEEHATIKLDEITMEVDELNLVEYTQLLLKIPQIAREFSDVIHEAQERSFEFEIKRDRYFNERSPFDESGCHQEPINENFEDGDSEDIIDEFFGSDEAAPTAPEFSSTTK